MSKMFFFFFKPSSRDGKFFSQFKQISCRFSCKVALQLFNACALCHGIQKTRFYMFFLIMRKCTRVNVLSLPWKADRSSLTLRRCDESQKNSPTRNNHSCTCQDVCRQQRAWFWLIVRYLVNEHECSTTPTDIWEAELGRQLCLCKENDFGALCHQLTAGAQLWHEGKKKIQRPK